MALLGLGCDSRETNSWDAPEGFPADAQCSWSLLPAFRSSDPRQRQRDALPHADAERREAQLRIALFQPPGQASARGGARSRPSGWPSAMAPPFGFTCRRRRRARARAHGERLRGERLVELDDVDVADRRAPRRASSFCAAGTGPMPMMRGVDARAGHAEHPRARRAGRALRTASARPGSAAAAPSLTPEALPAVTVPSARTIGFSFASASSVVSARGCSSLSTTTGSPRSAGHRHRHDLLREAARPRAPSPPAAGCAARRRPGRRGTPGIRRPRSRRSRASSRCRTSPSSPG